MMNGEDEGIVATVEDFRRSGWEEVISCAEPYDYALFSSRLSDEFGQAHKDGDPVRKEVFRILSAACSMCLRGDNRTAPFAPMWEGMGQRSAMPEDFGESSLDLFSESLPEIQNPWLRSRLADVLWIRRKEYKDALTAIDAYRQIPLGETRSFDGLECWKRALCLVHSLNGGAGNRLSEMVRDLLDAFRLALPNGDYLALKLSEILLEETLTESEIREVGRALEKQAVASERGDDNFRSEDYFKRCIQWFERLGDTTRETEARVGWARSLEREAINRESGDRASNIAAHIFYEKAIQAYRTIPNAQRGPYSVDQKLEQLRLNLRMVGEKSVDEMSTVTIDSGDISPLIKKSENWVQGRSRTEALMALSKLPIDVCWADLREVAAPIVRQNPLQTLVRRSTVSKDGRVVASDPGGSSEMDGGPEMFDASTDDQALRQFVIANNIRVPGCILPALRVLKREHSFQFEDFLRLAKESALVPVGRENLVGKALYFGYEEDFGSSLHLLVPQLEHIIREQLKANGANTTHLEDTGVETENSLNTLVDLPLMIDLFGEDLAAEIRALFCRPSGPNLRNEVAHGLVDDGSSESPNSIYAWWFLLKLITC